MPELNHLSHPLPSGALRAPTAYKSKYTIRKLRHERFGQSSERGALLEQLELQLADLEEDAAQAEAAARIAATAATSEKITVQSFERRQPARRPLPEHLPRERIVYPAPSTCPCCGGGTLRKIGKDVTETRELIPRQWIPLPDDAMLSLPGTHISSTQTQRLSCLRGRSKMLRRPLQLQQLADKVIE